jgi:hypothetical protein
MLNHPKSVGKFLLRLPASLHGRLKQRAAELDLSLNEYCCQVLASSTSGVRTDDIFARQLVTQAEHVLGDALVGVVLYGSWVRGETNDLSDIDAMLIVNDSVAITRSLLARWDEEPLTHEGRSVEVQFVRLPPKDQPVSGLWAELAIDGIIAFERGFAITSVLAKARSEVAAGRLQRRRSHGQYYWVHVKDEVA